MNLKVCGLGAGVWAPHVCAENQSFEYNGFWCKNARENILVNHSTTNNALKKNGGVFTRSILNISKPSALQRKHQRIWAVKPSAYSHPLETGLASPSHHHTRTCTESARAQQLWESALHFCHYSNYQGERGGKISPYPNSCFTPCGKRSGASETNPTKVLRILWDTIWLRTLLILWLGVGSAWLQFLTKAHCTIVYIHCLQQQQQQHHHMSQPASKHSSHTTKHKKRPTAKIAGNARLQATKDPIVLLALLTGAGSKPYVFCHSMLSWSANTTALYQQPINRPPKLTETEPFKNFTFIKCAVVKLVLCVLIESEHTYGT